MLALVAVDSGDEASVQFDDIGPQLEDMAHGGVARNRGKHCGGTAEKNPEAERLLP